jgi:hypothetical protein
VDKMSGDKMSFWSNDERILKIKVLVRLCNLLDGSAYHRCDQVCFVNICCCSHTKTL